MLKLIVLCFLTISCCGKQVNTYHHYTNHNYEDEGLDQGFKRTSFFAEIAPAPEDIPITYCTISDDKIIQDAAAVWNDALGMEVFRHQEEVSGCKLPIIQVTYIEGFGEIPEGETPVAQTILSWDQHEGRIDGWAIEYSYDLKDSDLYDSIVHELGHALGLKHDLLMDSVMFYKITSETQFITDADVARILERITVHDHDD